MPKNKAPGVAILHHYTVRLILPPLLAAGLLVVLLLLPVLVDRPAGPPAERAGLSALFDPLVVRAAGSVTLTKYANTSTVTPGGYITYTLILTNNSGVTITDVTITDTIPANTLCQNMSAPPEWLTTQAACIQRTPPATAVAWVLLPPTPFFGGVIPNGQSATVTYTVQVDQPLPDGLAIVNADTSYGFEVLSPTVVSDNGTDTVTVTVTAPAWQIGKTASPTPTVEAGTNLVYALTVTNTGALTTSGPFTITDPIPANTTFVAASDSGVNSGGTATWQFSSPLGPGQSRSVYLTVTVASPLTNGTTILNQTYAITGGSAYTGAVGGPVSVTVYAPATLTLTKQDNPDPVEAGARLVYTLTVTNDPASKGPADGVVVTDTVPANTVFDSAGIVGGSATVAAPPVGGSGIVTWTITSPDPLPVNQSVTLTMAVRVQTPLTNGTILTNTAYGASADNVVAPTAGAAVTTTVQSSPSITFSKQVQPQTVGLQQPVTYTIVITNSGNETVVNVPFTDVVQAPDFDPISRTWTVPVITGTDMAGQPGVLTYTWGFTSGLTPGDFGNVLTATVNGSDITLGPVATVTVIGQADLQVDKQAVVSQAFAGDLLTYTLTITNAPGSDTLDVRITDTFTNATLSAVTASTGTCSGSGPVVCTISSFTNTETITLTLQTSPVFSGVVTNTATITTVLPGITDPSPADNTDTVTIPVRRPTADLALSKAGPAATVVAGDPLTYTLTITNHGPDPVGVVVTDTFDPASGAASVSACTGGCTWSANSITWTLSTLNPGASQTLVLTLTANSAYSGTITNTAGITFSTAYSNAIDPGPNLNTGTVTTSVRLRQADLALSKAGPAATVVAGDPLTYTLTITNHGPDLVTVVVTDTFDPASGASFSACTGSCTPAGNNISWNWTLSPGASQNLVLTLTANSAYSGTITNTAGITFSTAYANAVDPGPNPNTDTVTSTVRLRQADLELRKAAASGSFISGSPITYTLTITNHGPDPVGVVVTDTFDPASGAASFSACTDGCSAAGNSISWNGLPVLNAGVSQTLVLTLTSNASYSGTITNTAGITFSAAYANAVDPGPNPNTDTVTSAVRQLTADIQVQKTLRSPTTVQVGDLITYTIAITNAGPDTASVVLTDTFTNNPTVSSVAGASCSGVGTTGPVVCTLPNLTGTTVITLVLDSSTALVGSGIVNRAEAYPSNGLDSNTGNNISFSWPAVTVTGAPALTFSKTASPVSGSTVSPGQTLVYNLNVTNLSTATTAASNVMITDTLPAGVGLVSVSTNGTHTQNGSQHVFSASSLGIGQSLTATLQVTVTATTSGTVITNQASASSLNGSLGTQMTTHTVVTQATTTSYVYLPIVLKNFTMMPDLTITSFSITPANPSSSDTVVVSVTIQNIGNAATEEGFWVDFYIDPNPVPDETMGERRWERLGSNVSPKKGIAWKVTSLLAPGQSLTLTSDGSGGTLAPDPTFSAAWLADPRFVPGTNNLYAYVDSYDSALIPEGEILESDETNNRAQITGLGVTGLAVQESGQPLPDNRPDVSNK